MKWVQSTRQYRERGVVSLLTVIFFMVFISLIVVGFTTIVIADQRQTIDNDLAASALAAARGGVEDGKRILVYCQNNPADTGCSDDVLNNQDCDAFTQGNGLALATKLGIQQENGEGVIGGLSAQAYQQYFTCLTIQKNTSSISSGSLDVDTDYIRPLRTVSDFNELEVSWSGTPGLPIRNGSLSGWPSSGSWGSTVSAVRLQVIPYTSLSGAFISNLDDLEAGTRTVYMVPCDKSILNGCPVSPNNIFAIDQRASANPPNGSLRSSAVDPPIIYVPCSKSGTSLYNCDTTLTGFTGGPGTTQYYIRASLLYAGATLTFSTQKDGKEVDFKAVQPRIDATGRTNDVFKRVRVEVAYKTTTVLPENALDSAAPICKKMEVTNDPLSSKYNCP